jgi:hypothetical protein
MKTPDDVIAHFTRQLARMDRLIELTRGRCHGNDGRPSPSSSALARDRAVVEAWIAEQLRCAATAPRPIAPTFRRA